MTFIITVVLGKIAIPMLRSLHAQQSIREEGPESHQAKAGTPTMGGYFHDGSPVHWWLYLHRGMWVQVCYCF